MCSNKFITKSAYYVHRYDEHNIKLPKLQDELNIIHDVSDEYIYNAQRVDPTLQYIFTYLNNESTYKLLNNNQKHDINSHCFLYNESNILYCIDKPTAHSRAHTRTHLRLVCPKTMRTNAIRAIHSSVIAPHFGITHTIDKMREYAWWPSMLRDIYYTIQKCDICQRMKKNRRKTALLRPVLRATRPWSVVGVDVTGPLPLTMKGHKFILVVVCQFSKWVETFPMVDQNTITIADIIVMQIICRYGLMDVIVSDNGSVFVSELAKQIYALLGIKRLTTAPYHPPGLGGVEIVNRTLKVTLPIWLSENQDDWDLLHKYFDYAMNISYHTTIQETPFYVNRLIDARTITDIALNAKSESFNSVHDYINTMIDRIARTHERVKSIYESINKQRETDIAVAVAKGEETYFNIGEQVLIYSATTKVVMSAKLTVRWLGPYTIVSRAETNVNYIVKVNNENRIINVDRIRKYNTPIEEEDYYLTQQREQLERELEIIADSQQQLAVTQIKTTNELELAKAKELIQNKTPTKVQFHPIKKIQTYTVIPEEQKEDDIEIAVEVDNENMYNEIQTNTCTIDIEDDIYVFDDHKWR